MLENRPVVLLRDEGVLGVIVQDSGHYAKVMFFHKGMKLYIYVDKEDIVELDQADL